MDARKAVKWLAELLAVKGEAKCAICDWTLAESANSGCVRGNCSMRGGSVTENMVLRKNTEEVEEFQHVLTEAGLVDILELLKKMAESMNCVCRLNSFIGDPVPCETCRMKVALARFEEKGKG